MCQLKKGREINEHQWLFEFEIEADDNSGDIQKAIANVLGYCYQKWLITQSLLVDMTGAKAAAVKSAMGNYQTDIDSHNKVLTEAGATSLLNRKGELKEDFCDEWVRHIPSGLD